MQVLLEQNGAINRKITVTIPASKIDSAVEDKIKSLKKTVKIDGFRQGKVPVSVIKKKYSGAIRADIVNDLIQSSYPEALEKENISPASAPKIDSEKDAFMDGDFTYTAEFDVYPEIKLTDFSKFKIEIPLSQVEDTDVEKTIQDLRKQNKVFVESKTASKDGSQVTIDFVGRMDGVEFEGGKAEDMPVIIGSKSMIEGFESGLTGLKADEETTLDITFPEDYQAENLAGKAAQFAIKVKKVENPKLPKLDDEFFAKFNIKEGGEQAFTAQIRKNMEVECNRAKKQFIKNQVLDTLSDKYAKLEIPNAAVEQEITGMVNTLKRQMQGQGNLNGNLDDLFKDNSAMRPEAKRRVRLGLVIAEIIQVNNIQINQDKLKSFVEDESVSYDDPEQFIKYYMDNEENLRAIEPVVLELQVVDHIVTLAKTKEVKMPFDKLTKTASKTSTK